LSDPLEESSDHESWWPLSWEGIAYIVFLSMRKYLLGQQSLGASDQTHLQRHPHRGRWIEYEVKSFVQFESLRYLLSKLIMSTELVVENIIDILESFG
jgi:hypothetical protein